MACQNRQLPSYGRKFRSQTSDNMDRWKRRGGKGQRGDEQKREDQRKEREKRTCRRTKKYRSHHLLCFFHCFVASEGRKVGSLKRWVLSHLAKLHENCTAMWHEAHLQVKRLKACHVGRNFWKLRRRKGARPSGPKHMCKSTFTTSGHCWKLTCRTSAGRRGAKHIWTSSVLTADGLGPLMGVHMPFRMARARDAAPCQKWAKRENFEISTTIHHNTPQYATVHYTTLGRTRLHCSALH